MLRIIFTSIFMVSAIFWGVYPPVDDSPLVFILQYMNIDYKPTKLIHIILGIVFYILGVFTAQQESLKNLWF
jgi:hypothetical protein